MVLFIDLDKRGIVGSLNNRDVKVKKKNIFRATIDCEESIEEMKQKIIKGE